LVTDEGEGEEEEATGATELPEIKGGVAAAASTAGRSLSLSWPRQWLVAEHARLTEMLHRGGGGDRPSDGGGVHAAVAGRSGSGGYAVAAAAPWQREERSQRRQQQQQQQALAAELAAVGTD
jgi:hypothetical protein